MLWLLLFFVYSCQCQNEWEELTDEHGYIYEWRSLSPFEPQQSQHFGKISIGQIMTMQFDFTWKGRSGTPNADRPENFFRVGFDANIDVRCDGERSRYPSFWLQGQSNRMMVSVSNGAACADTQTLDDYGEIVVGNTYRIYIGWNQTLLDVKVTGGGNPDWRRTWTRNPTLDQYLGKTAMVWWMSNKYRGRYNQGLGTFNNVVITSHIHTITPYPTTTPTSDTDGPTPAPSGNPTPSPTEHPTAPPTPAPSGDPTPAPTEDPTAPPTPAPIICSTKYNDSEFCEFNGYSGLTADLSDNSLSSGEFNKEYIVLNASHNSRIFMIRWGFMKNDRKYQSLKYEIKNNVFIEAYMDDYGRNDRKYATEFTLNQWSKNGIPLNAFPEQVSYESCSTIYLSSREYIKEVSYNLDANNSNAIIGLKFVTSTSKSYICPPGADQNDEKEWDFVYNAHGLVKDTNRTMYDDSNYWMLIGFQFKIYGFEQEKIDNNGEEIIYLKKGVFAGFDSLTFGHSCNPPCFYSVGGRIIYNEDLFDYEELSKNDEYLKYKYKLDFDTAQSVCNSIGSTLATIHPFNDLYFLDNTWIGSKSPEFWIDDTPILRSRINILIDSSNYGCGWLTDSLIVYERCTDLKPFYCNNPRSQRRRVNVWMRCCDGWKAKNHVDGEMNIIFKAERKFSQFFVLNKESNLPSDDNNSMIEEDKWELYDLSSDIFQNQVNISDYGQLIQFEMQMDSIGETAWNIFQTNNQDFCMAGIVLQFGDQIYSRTSSINGGVVLSTKCSKPWFENPHSSLPYLQCFDSLFLLSAVSNDAGQYKVSITVCGQSSSGISVDDSNNLKMSLTGKSYIEGVWKSTQQIPLSYPFKNPSLSSVLTFVASQNVFISGDFIQGSEITKYIISASMDRGSLEWPIRYQFKPKKEGYILGYHLSFSQSVRIKTNDEYNNMLLLPIMYQFGEALINDFGANTVDRWMNAARKTFMAPIGENKIQFRSLHDYSSRTAYITNHDTEIYVIFEEAKNVKTSDKFMISMVFDSFAHPWADKSEGTQHWDEYKTAYNYGYAKAGPIAAISFIYQDDYKNVDAPFTINKSSKNWNDAGRACSSNAAYSNLASLTNSNKMVWAHLETANSISPPIEPIFVRITRQYEIVLNSDRSGADKNLMVFAPVIGENEYYVTMIAYGQDAGWTDTYKGEDTIVITGGPSNAFAVPTSYKLTLKTKGRTNNVDEDGRDVMIALLRPVAPSGYICLGDVAWYWETEDDKDVNPADPSIFDALYGYRCIKKTYLVEFADPDKAFDQLVKVWNGKKKDAYYFEHKQNFGPDYEDYYVRFYDFLGSKKDYMHDSEYSFNPSLTLLSYEAKDDTNNPWVGLRQSSLTNEWVWIDQTELKMNDVITMDSKQVANAGECAVLSPGLISTQSQTKTTFGGKECDEEREYYLCETANDGQWNANEGKSFLVTIPPGLFDEAILVTLENTGSNAICVDQISIEKETATFISSYWIAKKDNTDDECVTNACQQISYGIIKYPVCAIDVISMRYNWEDDSQWIETMNITAAVSECQNYNRLHFAGCEVSQSITISDEVGFEVEDGFTYSESYSSGSSKTNEQSKSKSDSYSITIGTEVGITMSSSTETEVGSVKHTSGQEFSWFSEFGYEEGKEVTYGTSKTEEKWSESSYEESNERSTTNSWSQTQEHDVTCTASIEVPPSHKQTYSLLMNRYRGIVPVMTDLKLTLCSKYIDPSNVDTQEHYRYIYDVPSEEYISSITKCEVQFDEPSVLLNHLTCDQEQELSFLSGSTYLPTCNQTNPTKYDGCQCQIIDTLTSAVCACVDMEGNVLNNNHVLVVETEDWRDTCNMLNCDNSIYRNNDQQILISENNNELQPNMISIPNNNDKNNITSIFILIAVVAIGIGSIIMLIALKYKSFKFNKVDTIYDTEFEDENLI